MVTNSESLWQINYVQFHAMGEDIMYNLEASCIDLHNRRENLLSKVINKRSLRKAQDFKNTIIITISENNLALPLPSGIFKSNISH